MKRHPRRTIVIPKLPTGGRPIQRVRMREDSFKSPTWTRVDTPTTEVLGRAEDGTWTLDALIGIARHIKRFRRAIQRDEHAARPSVNAPTGNLHAEATPSEYGADVRCADDNLPNGDRKLAAPAGGNDQTTLPDCPQP